MMYAFLTMRMEGARRIENVLGNTLQSGACIDSLSSRAVKYALEEFYCAANSIRYYVGPSTVVRRALRHKAVCLVDVQVGRQLFAEKFKRRLTFDFHHVRFGHQ